MYTVCASTRQCSFQRNKETKDLWSRKLQTNIWDIEHFEKTFIWVRRILIMLRVSLCWPLDIMQDYDTFVLASLLILWYGFCFFYIVWCFWIFSSNNFFKMYICFCFDLRKDTPLIKKMIVKKSHTVERGCFYRKHVKFTLFYSLSLCFQDCCHMLILLWNTYS